MPSERLETARAKHAAADVADLVSQLENGLNAYPELVRHNNNRRLPLHVQVLPDSVRLLREYLEIVKCL